MKINEIVQEDKPLDPVPIQKEVAVKKPPVLERTASKNIVKELVKTCEEMRKGRLKEGQKKKVKTVIYIYSIKCSDI